MEPIIRGTTPSFIVDFTDVTAFTVADIEEVALTFKRRAQINTYKLSDLEIGETTLIYHWTQAQTLAMEKGEKIKVDMHVLANGERYKINNIPSMLTVVDTLYNEEM